MKLSHSPTLLPVLTSTTEAKEIFVGCTQVLLISSCTVEIRTDSGDRHRLENTSGDIDRCYTGGKSFLAQLCSDSGKRRPQVVSSGGRDNEKSV